MRRLSFLYLLAPLAVLILVLGTACGDDDDEEDATDGGGEELTLEAYFGELEGLSTQFDEDRLALEDKYPDAFDTVEETRQLFEEAWPLLSKLAEDLEAINPPPEAEDLHARTITSASESSLFLQNTVGVLEDAKDEDLPELVENSSSLTETLQRLQDACLDQQALADRESIDVDLKCPTDEP